MTLGNSTCSLAPNTPYTYLFLPIHPPPSTDKPFETKLIQVSYLKLNIYHSILTLRNRKQPQQKARVTPEMPINSNRVKPTVSDWTHAPPISDFPPSAARTRTRASFHSRYEHSQPFSRHRYRCGKTVNAGTLNGSWPSLSLQALFSNMSLSHAQTHPFFFVLSRRSMMSPLRYKSSKGSTCHIRSSKYPPSQLPPSPEHSVILLTTALAITSFISSVVYRMYTTSHAPFIFRPAASLTYYPP